MLPIPWKLDWIRDTAFPVESFIAIYAVPPADLFGVGNIDVEFSLISKDLSLM